LTLAQDYTITVYNGYGEFNKTSDMSPYESLNFYGNGDYYTGYFKIYELFYDVYDLVVESEGYIKNF
jgi:hypothetical protein